MNIGEGREESMDSDAFGYPAVVRRADSVGPHKEVRALTSRQLEVLSLVAAGEPDKRIAELLGISERCVRFHVHGCLERTGSQTRAQAVAVAIVAGQI